MQLLCFAVFGLLATVAIDTTETAALDRGIILARSGLLGSKERLILLENIDEERLIDTETLRQGDEIKDVDEDEDDGDGYRGN